MKREVIAAVIVLFLIHAAYGLNLGTVLGYTVNNTGVPEANSEVNITVIGCTGSGCAAVVNADANGYFIKSNLNVIPGTSVRIAATKGNQFGNITAVASGTGSVGVVNANVTMCVAPTQPVLTPVSDSHTNALVTMAWTTFKAGLEYDEFIFNSGTSNTSANSPQVQTNIAYQQHTWKVRTCNAVCCSDYATDTFTISNSLPATPTLIDQANTNQNTISFNWSHSGADADGDTVTFDFQLDGATTTNVTKPYTVTGIATGSHTWGVRACDGIGCTSYAQDSFSITNSIASSPLLIDQGHTSLTSVDFTWTNYSDGDGDPTHTEFQLSTSDDFSTIVANDSNAVSPKTISGLSTFTLYYWRVRTCDNQNACSSYEDDSFFVYESTGSTTVVSGGSKTKYENVSCEPIWECSDWGQCSSRGISTRTCKDVSGCSSSVPSPYQFCSYDGPSSPIQEEPLPVTSEGKYYLGNLNTNPLLQAEMGIMQEWEFVYGSEQHVVRIISIDEDGAVIEITSEPKRYFIAKDVSITADITGDGLADVEVRVVQKNHKSIALVFSTLREPETQTPLNTELILKDIQEKISNLGAIPLGLGIMILLLLGALYYQNARYVVREKKIDAALMKYVQSALNKGFTREHIRQKLLTTGFAQEEVDYILKKIESQNSVPQEH